MNVRRPDDPNEAFGASPPGLLLRIFFSSINPMGELDEKAGVWV